MIISLKTVAGLRTLSSAKRIVFVSGSFDLLHARHICFLEDCKKLGDLLVVAVGPDAEIRKNKGEGRPILNEHIRLKMVDSLKPVDYAFLSNPSAPGEGLLSPLQEIFYLFRPDIWAINYDGEDLEGRHKVAREFGIRFVVLRSERDKPPEYEGVSTSSIIEKIRKLPA